MKREKIIEYSIIGIIIILTLLFYLEYSKINEKEQIGKKTVVDKNYNQEGLTRKIINGNEYNVVLIVIDTLRPDHLSSYNYPRKTSPHIDKFVREGTIFMNAFTNIPYTTSAHISMMTGKRPFAFQPRMPNAKQTGVVIAKDEMITLAEILRAKNFNTAGYISVGMMAPESGLSQGFLTYNYSEGVRPGNETTKYALDWLEENHQDKFFLFFHLYDPHDSYVPPEEFDIFSESKPLTDEIGLTDFTAIKRSIDKYDGEIRLADNLTGQILHKIKELDIEDNTLVIITSDHGEQFGEHIVPIYRGMGPQVLFEHARALYEQEIKVALIMKLPNVIPKNKKVYSLVEHVDILPTILDILNLPEKTSSHGVSLVPAILKSEDVRNYTISHLYPVISPYYRTSIRTKNYKLIYDQEKRNSEFFDLKNDPEEQINLIKSKEYQDIIKELEKKLIEEIIANTEDTSIYNPSLKKEGKQRLANLGYLE